MLGLLNINFIACSENDDGDSSYRKSASSGGSSSSDTKAQPDKTPETPDLNGEFWSSSTSSNIEIFTIDSSSRKIKLEKYDDYSKYVSKEKSSSVEGTASIEWYYVVDYYISDWVPALKLTRFSWV